MQKTLKDLFEVYRPKSPDEQKFVDKHVTIKHKDRNGNGDDVFNASNVKTIKRKEDNHGYDSGDDEKVYEEVEDLDADELEESAKVAAHLIKRYGTNVRKSHVRSAANDFGVGFVALSHAVRKKLGVNRLDEDEQIDELSTSTLKSYRTKARADAYDADDVDDDRRFRKRAAGSNTAGKKLVKRGESLKTEEIEQVDEGEGAYRRYNQMMKRKRSEYEGMIAKHMDAGHDRDSAIKKAQKEYESKEASRRKNARPLPQTRDLMKKEEVEEVDERFGDGDQRYDTRPEPKPAEKEPKTRLGQFLKKRKEKAAKANMDKLAADYAERQRTYRTHRESEEIDVESLDLLNSIEEKKLTPAEMKKREEVAKAIERENPKMPMAKKMAIATATAKKVAEEAESIDELSRETVGRYSMKAKSIADNEGGKDRTKGRELAGRKRWGGSMAGVEKAKVMATEESDQIDEISTKLALDYTDKASDARGHKNLSTPKLDKRYKSMALAHEKIRARHAKVATTEEVEELGEDVGAQINELIRKKNATTSPIARKNIESQIAKLKGQKSKMSEEVEGLEELSKATLGSYTYKAAKEIGDKGVTAGLKIQNSEPAGKDLNKMGRRMRGVAKAVGKLTKEQVIDNAIEKFMPVLEDYKPMTQEEKLVAKLDGLSESHVLTLLSLFEDLNEDNRTKMLGIVDTHEGINSLLDFALQNRGE